MEWNQDIRSDPKLRLLSTWLVIAIVGIALLAVAGWSMNVFPLRRTITGLIAMEPSTAYCFLFSGTAFLLLHDTPTERLRKTIGHFLSAIVFIISLAGMSQAFPTIGRFFEEHVFSATGYSLSLGNAFKLNFTTSFSFFFVSLALFTLHDSIKDKYVPSQFFALHSLFAGFFAALGVLYKVETLYGNQTFNIMSVHSAGCFVLFSLALLLVQPKKGVINAFLGRGTGSTMGRAIIPYAIIIPALLGYIRLYGHFKGWYSVEAGVVFMVTAIIILFNGLVWYTALQLNSKDRQREASELALKESEHRFRQLVSNVTDYAIFLIDSHGIIQNWNEGAAAIAGYTEHEIVGKPFSVFYQEKNIAEKEPIQHLAMAAAKGHYESEGWRVRKNGSRFWANNVLTVVHDSHGKIEGFVNITRDISQRKTDQEQIAYLARMIEDTTDAVISVDLSLNIRTWNKAAETLYGYSPAEAIGQNMGKIFRITTPEEKQKTIRADMVAKGYWKGEVNHTTKSGEPLTILISIAQTKTPHGSADGFVMVCRDISERKKMEENLQVFNSELSAQVKIKTVEYSNMLERVTDAFVAMDREFRITFLNSKAAGMSRSDPAELIGKTIWDLAPELVSLKTCQEFVTAMDDQQYHYVTAFIEKFRLWVEYHIYPAPEGLSVFVKDVTDRKRAEEALLYSEETRKLIIQSSMDAIICFDLQGKVTVYNTRAEDCFGWNEKEVVGTAIGRIIRYLTAGETFDWIHYLKTAESKEVKQGVLETTAFRKNGESFPIELTIVPIRQDGDEFYCAFIRDISIRKEAEANLQRSYQEIRELASHLQHVREEERADIAREIHDELGQQLTAIKMDMAWTAKKAELSGSDDLQKKLKGAIVLIDSSIQSVRRIATNLHPSILDDLGLIAAIEWYSQEFEKRSGIVTRFSSGINDFKFPPRVAIALFRICQESLTNVSRHSKASEVLILLEAEEDLVLTITDNGQGFDPAAKRERKSLGLVGMKERAQMLEGSYEIFSAPGEGTRIVVSIPSRMILAPATENIR